MMQELVLVKDELLALKKVNWRGDTRPDILRYDIVVVIAIIDTI